jgi:hypothetical protein
MVETLKGIEHAAEGGAVIALGASSAENVYEQLADATGSSLEFTPDGGYFSGDTYDLGLDGTNLGESIELENLSEAGSEIVSLAGVAAVGFIVYKGFEHANPFNKSEN